MVFFTCSGCGESLKKAQVEKHRMRCHRSYLLTCIDCCKDFHGEEYQTHLKCISENQKYGGQNYVPKENKGEAKQEKWFDLVQQAIDQISQSGDYKLKGLLEKIRSYPNIPRKEAKFMNFVSNSIKERNMDLVTKAWSAITSVSEKLKSTSSEQKQAKSQSAQECGESSNETNIAVTHSNGLSDATNDVIPVKSSKKRKKTNNQSEDAAAIPNIDSEQAVDGDDTKKIKKRKSQECVETEFQDQPETICEKIPPVGAQHTTVLDEPSAELCDSSSAALSSGNTSMKYLIKKSLKDAVNNELTLKKLKKLVTKQSGLKSDEEKVALHTEIEAYLKKKTKKYVTDGKIVRFATEC